MRAQASIEFLLVFAAVISFLAVFASAFSGLEEASLFALDSRNAENFSSALRAASEKLSYFGDGTSIEFEYSVLGEWEITGNTLTVRDNTGNEFTAEIPLEITAEQKSFSGRTVFTLEKTGGGIFLSGN